MCQMRQLFVEMLTKCESHINNLYSMYNNIVDLLKVAGETLKTVSNNGHKGVPGWNGHIAELHKVAREAFLLWKDSGVPNKAQYLNERKDLMPDLTMHYILLKIMKMPCELNY